MTGTIALVGAGPGDPMLLTRRAARLLAGADVVVLDRPSLAPIADLAPVGAERCFVGRAAAEGAEGWETDQVVDLLVDRAAKGFAVVRLKSGDPFVCSRGSEEYLALRARGLRCDVVPGVSAATAAPLAADLPRGRAVTIVAGNRDATYPPLDFSELADPASSLVVLVGRAQQAAIGGALVAGGLDPRTSAVLVHGATRTGARTERTTVGELGGLRLPPPTTIVIGPGDLVATEELGAHP